MKKYLPIGKLTYAAGRDLSGVISDLLEEFRKVNVKSAVKWTAAYTRMYYACRGCPDCKRIFLDELLDGMGTFCFPGTYVGYHIGDGADIGCWVQPQPDSE